MSITEILRFNNTKLLSKELFDLFDNRRFS